MKENVDAVDRIIEQWRTERPDLDPSAKAVTARVVRASDLVLGRLEQGYAPLGLKRGQYGALAALRRSGAPYEQAPSALIEQLVVSSGGLSLMIDRLERDGLVRRRPNPDDRRGVLVALTDEGVRVIDEAMGIHAAIEHELVDGLSPRERDQLAKLLAKFLEVNRSA